MAALEVGDVVYVKQMGFYSTGGPTPDMHFGDLYYRAVVLSKPLRVKWSDPWNDGEGYCTIRYLSVVRERGMLGWPEAAILTEVPEDARVIS